MPGDNKDALRQRLEELDKKATPGPWAWGFTGDDGNCAIGFAITPDEQPLTGELDEADEDWIVREPVCADVEGSGNAELISFLRSAIPEILSAFQQLHTVEAERDGLKKEMNAPRAAICLWCRRAVEYDPSVPGAAQEAAADAIAHDRVCAANPLLQERDALKASNEAKDARIEDLETGVAAQEEIHRFESKLAAAQARCAALEKALAKVVQRLGFMDTPDLPSVPDYVREAKKILSTPSPTTAPEPPHV